MTHFLGDYVREKKIVSFEEGIRKMTSLPAGKLNLNHRGLLKQGYFADVVILDPDTVCDKATYVDPSQYPVGIDTVIVNGQIAVKDGKQTDVCNGRVVGR